DERPIREWGHDAQWTDEFHHNLHVLLTDERDGYYANYPPSVSGLAQQFERRPAERLVYCSQNHDQVGNRAFGDPPRTADRRLLALRRELPREVAVTADEEARVLRVWRGDVELALDFANLSVALR